MDLEGDNKLNLTSNRCYYELDTKYVNDGKDEEYEKLEKKSGDYTKAAVLCMGLNGNLKNYDKLNIFQKMNNYKCNYLNLWAYDRLSKLEKNEQLSTKILILTLWSKSKQYKEECNPSQFGSYSNSTDHITEKKLYDYALNYGELNFRYKENDIIACTRNIAEYIRESKELYKRVEQECKHDSGAHAKRYCSALENIKTIYPNNELLNLECKRVEEESASSREDSEGPKTWQNEDTSGLQQRLQRVSPEGRIAEESTSSLPLSEVGSSSDSHQVAATAVPILGISSIFFLLYKFTGLGSMARNFLRTKGINGINSQEELTHELLENTYDDNAHPDIDETYIGYQSI
ncbi:PIR Superfamily Protein [Plasmodium ovale wallikeri]|uniref:PIR Superfamily Protein n=1 Tax=Plasmodium ovale wallikeri TaxID=864142 RepID=A0A1A9AC46_PLAOA|nr:PIR Superfamily Protein [Plasmodium ovale wallikeri]